MLPSLIDNLFTITAGRCIFLSAFFPGISGILIFNTGESIKIFFIYNLPRIRFHNPIRTDILSALNLPVAGMLPVIVFISAPGGIMDGDKLSMVRAILYFVFRVFSL